MPAVVNKYYDSPDTRCVLMLVGTRQASTEEGSINHTVGLLPFSSPQTSVKPFRKGTHHSLIYSLSQDLRIKEEAVNTYDCV